MEAYGFCLSRSRIKYLEFKFSNGHTGLKLKVQMIGELKIPKVLHFKYLGSRCNMAEIKGDINHWIPARWTIWRRA